MAKPEIERVIQQSVLDRLIDLEPFNHEEAPPTRAQSLRKLRAAVKRDLEWLLNTRRNPDPIPEAYRELLSSVHAYGLPDISSYGLSNPSDEKRLLRSLESTISYFEPRLRNVRVTSLEPIKKKMPTLRFQIEAMLMIEPAPELISFDTVLDMATQEYLLKDDRGA